MKKFNLLIVFKESNLAIREVSLSTVNEIRHWVSECRDYISIGNKIVNLRYVQYIVIDEVEND